MNSKHDDVLPIDALELMRSHGMRTLEWRAGERAKDEAIRSEREYWLPKLEGWLAADEYPDLRSFLKTEIKRLRRCLSVATPLEEQREKTRERVRQWRAARRIR